jgi:hypothetical protein
MAVALSPGVPVHHTHFTVDLVVTLLLVKDGIRVCLRGLFCVCATVKQRPGCNENDKQAGRHFCYVDLEDGKSSDSWDFRFVGRLCQTPIQLVRRFTENALQFAV